jgi:hypothetical protein
MFRLLLDHNFNQRVFRQVLLRVPKLDYVTAEELGLESAADPAVLERAAAAEPHCAHPRRRDND